MKFLPLITLLMMGYSLTSHASFIESSMGTAVVEDATATYFNPATLAFLKKKQVIALGTLGYPRSKFIGQTTNLIDVSSFAGTATTGSRFILPSFYYSMPLASKWSIGLAFIINDLKRDIDSLSMFGDSQSKNQVNTKEIVPAISYRFNKQFSVGCGLDFASASFITEPIAGFPNLEIPDTGIHNESKSPASTWDIGLFIKPTKKTLIGFNHRRALVFDMHGDSMLKGFPAVISNGFHFTTWIPARTAFSIDQKINSKLKIIGTLHYVEWSIFKQIDFYNLAREDGILPLDRAPFFYHNSWIFTAGSNYRLNKKIIVRIAGSYLQTPSTGNFQIDNGDSVTLGVSMGYTISKKLTVDCSYAHAFVRNLNINITDPTILINGSTGGYLDSFALKLTVTI